MNIATLRHVSNDIKTCLEILEKDVRSSLTETAVIITNETDTELDKERDYHYNEILRHLDQMKKSLKEITQHDKSIYSIESKMHYNYKNTIQHRIDRNYIKKQVEAFQNNKQIETVHRRENKTVRPPETSSMKYLESWENFLVKQEEIDNLPENNRVTINKRGNKSNRHQKKIISSTSDRILETWPSYDQSLIVIEEDNHILEDNTDTKPRIVDVIVSNLEVCVGLTNFFFQYKENK